ncbi:MAG: alanine racemase [Sandaracinaceae bacterium]
MIGPGAGDAVRPTRAEVDLDALASNLTEIRRRTGDARVLAVVKADAYGHGLLPVARHLAASGVEGFCVALVEEGLALREAGIERPVLVLNGIYGRAHRAVVEAGLTPIVYDAADLAAFSAVAQARKEPVGLHLKVDTGMGRLGVPRDDLEAFLDRLAGLPGLRVDGLMTHLASAEDDEEATARQLARFDEARRAVEERGHRPAVLHTANSAGALLRPPSRRSLVRVGLALYGVPPAPGSGAGLRPVLRLVSTVARVATLRPGESVGYGRTWRAPSPSRVATLAIGYGDGLPWRLTNRGQVLVGGRRCPIVGRVSMDLVGVDVSAVEACARGDEAVLIGAQGAERIRVEELAAWSGTLSYEILTRLSPRIPRRYRRAGNVHADAH